MFSYLRRGKAFYRNVVTLATPIVLQNIVTTALGLCDTFMVGLLGEAPMAAVTLANLPVFVIQLLVFGIQSGSSVLISQYWGKGDTGAINRVLGIGFFVAGGISTLFALVMFFFPAQLMGMLTNNSELVELSLNYCRLVGFSYMFNSITGVYVGAHRSMENPKLGLCVFTASMLLNTFLNWVFIFGSLGAPRLEVTGAALATLISRIVEFVIMAGYAAVNKRFRIRPRLLLRPGRVLVQDFIRYSTPVVMNETLWGLGSSIYPTIMGHMDRSTEILAAYTISGNVEKIFTVVVFGLASTAAIIIGREIGAGRRDTIYEVGCALNTLAVLVGAVMGGLMVLAARSPLGAAFYSLFHLSPWGAETATMMLTFLGLIMPLRSFDTTNVVGVLRGGGDVRAATIIDLCPLWFVAIPLAFLFGIVLKWGIFWVYVGLTMESVCKSFIGVWRLRSRKWINDLTRMDL
ncbi:MAG: MATE family efflux transporter [Oscillospiraceae bacterium]|nr:MATE family efflux transporter [Oscillospiraceae bacterium]